MLNDLIENKGIKCITPSHNTAQKYLLPYLMASIGIIGAVMFITFKAYFNLILVLPVFLALAYYMFWDFKRIPNKVYIDYANREFIFLFRNRQLRKSFNDMISVKRQIVGRGIELVFQDNEKYLLPFLTKSPYREIKFILDNRMGEFLTEQKPLN